MFGGLVNLIAPTTVGPPPKNIPQATPVILPQCNPQQGRTRLEGDRKHDSVVRFLQSIYKPTELNEAHFAALGVHVHLDATANDVLPDPTFLPSNVGWDDLSVDQARGKDSAFRRALSNDKLSPEARVYLERRQELATDNQAAFRTVRRIRPEPGIGPARLGNAYEFFRQLEMMATYWDDTSMPPLPTDEDQDSRGEDAAPPPLPPRPNAKGDGKEQTELAKDASTAAEKPEAATVPQPKSSDATSIDPKDYRVTYRTATGASMPAELRHSLITAFMKLVAYDFGCNPAPPKVEPRLHLLEPPIPDSPSQKRKPPRHQRASYFPSGCVFLWRTPAARDAARAGVTEGPLVAISARNTTNFGTPTDHNIDFGRELVAALATAQHRAREGQQEKRFGEGEWWATAKRWGGGEGGPIGREEERDAIMGDKDAKPSGDPTATAASDDDFSSTEGEKPKGTSASTSSSRPKSPPHPLSPASGLPMRGTVSASGPGAEHSGSGGQPAPKRVRKNFSMYDNYRRVRPPTSNWDKRARYLAIGKQKKADYDDIFVVSSLYHHVSILRVRVPQRLLDVLGGASEQAQAQAGKEPAESSTAEAALDWGRVEMWRSQWFDLFKADERLEALRLVWGMTAWMMRKDDGASDVTMKGV